MRILITNDDGIYSDGLWSLAEALRDVGEVCVVAPDRDQSGVGTAMTIMAVVRAREITPRVENVKTYLVQGTPADCVILATGPLFSEPFDIMFSGINEGANLGMDVLVSGTVGGAVHGYLRGIPSIAISAVYSQTAGTNFEAAADVARTLALSLAKGPQAATPFLNVNLPAGAGVPGADGVQVTRLGERAFLEHVEQGADGRRTHYWIKHTRPPDVEGEAGTDLWAIQNNFVSITPIGPALSNGVFSEAVEAVADDLRAAMGLR